MDIQTALHEILASPTARDVALVAVPGLVTGLIMVFRQEHKHLKNQVREQLNLLTEQNKDVADLKSTIVELRAQQKTTTDRMVELKQQVDQLHTDLEKTRDDFNINQLYSSIDNGPEDNTPSSTQFQPVPSLQSEGIAEMLQSLEDKPAPVEQPPVFTAAQAQAVTAQAQQAQPPVTPPPAAAPLHDSLHDPLHDPLSQTLSQTLSQAMPNQMDAGLFDLPEQPAAPTAPAAAPVQEPAVAPRTRKPAAAKPEPVATPDMTQSFAAPSPSDTAFDLDQYL